MMRSGGRVAMLASIRREEMALTFWTAGAVRGSNMMPTPADSCLRVSFFAFFAFSFAFACVGDGRVFFFF